MTRGSHNGWWRRLAAMGIALAVCAPWPASGQSVTAPVLTAAFIFSFAKFTTWPTDLLAPNQVLSLCVVGDEAVRDALEQTVEGRAIGAHKLSVRVLRSSDAVESCHLVYVNAAEFKRAEPQLRVAKAAPVLTVSDVVDFAESGGIAQLVQEGDRMRFTVNLAAARRARLILSSKLLKLAKVIER